MNYNDDLYLQYLLISDEVDEDEIIYLNNGYKPNGDMIPQERPQNPLIN